MDEFGKFCWGTLRLFVRVGKACAAMRRMGRRRDVYDRLAAAQREADGYDSTGRRQPEQRRVARVVRREDRGS